MNRTRALCLALALAVAGGGVVASAGDASAARPAATSSAASTPPADARRPDPAVKLAEVFKPLVDNGTLTQSQADKVVTALVAALPARPAEGTKPVDGQRPPKGDKPADGVKPTGGQRPQKGDKPAGEAGRPDRAAKLAETLAPLVTDGTITQAQADSITAALKDARPERGEHRGHRGGDRPAPASAPNTAG